MLMIIIAVFVILPNAVDILGFSGEQFFGGELWRILSYPYAHVSSMHLIENVVALVVIVLLMMELELGLKQFAYLFLGTCLLVALVSGLIVPKVVMVGASMGLFALFGGLALKGKEIIPWYMTYGIFGIIIFLNFLVSITSSSGFEQPVFHALGFVVGTGIFKVQEKLKIKKRILQQ